MLFIVIFGMLWGGPQDTPQPTPLRQQAREQAEIYVAKIEQEISSDLYLWSLAKLCENRQVPEIPEYINTLVSKSSFQVPGSERFCAPQPFGFRLEKLAFEHDSRSLLLASLLEQKDAVNGKQLLERFNRDHAGPDSEDNLGETLMAVVNKDSLSEGILPTDRFQFAHFLLIYSSYSYQNGIITRHYLQTLTNQLDSHSITSDSKSIVNSMALLTYMRGLYLNNRYVEVYNLYDRILQENLFPVSHQKIDIYNFLDYTMYHLGFYDIGLRILRSYAIPLSRFLDLPNTETTLLESQGTYLYRIGKIKEAQAIYEQVQQRSQSRGTDIIDSRLYNNLSITYLKSGNFDSYLNLQFRALEMAQSKEIYSHQFKILRNLHVYYRRIGNKQASKNYINMALELARSHDQTDDLASVYTSLGVFYRDLLSKPDSAQVFFSKAQEVVLNSNNYNREMILLREQAKLLENEQRYTEALEIYHRMQEKSEAKESTQIYLDTRIDQGRIHLLLDEIEAAGTIVEELRDAELSLLDFSEIVKAKTLQANYLIHKEESSRAIQILDPTINQIVERARNSTDIQSGYWHIEPEYLAAFQLYVDLLIDTGRSEEAVLALDRLKTINDAELYQEPMVKSSQLNEAELNQYRQLSNELDRLRKQLLVVSAEEEKVEIENQINRLHASKRVLDRKISSYADQPDLASMDQIQRHLSPKTIMLHITELNDTYYLAQISKRAVHFSTIPLDGETRQLFNQAIGELAHGTTDLNKLYRIGQILNIDRLPPMADHVIMIPDSYLFQLPLDILPLYRPEKPYSYGEARYMIEHYKTDYLTSIAELVYQPESASEHEWDFVGFGISEFRQNNQNLMPLPYARHEVTEIAKELSNLTNSRTILESHSTKQSFRETAPKAKILHLATHSKLSDNDPLFSTIYMSPPSGDTENGEPEEANSRIYAYELFEMNLSNELIMLNSCESGSGSYLQGSGIIGISRALRFAGAESLILNLWSVNDMMASDFAIQFYRSINTGDSKSSALRKAKTHFLRHKNANPHYWGPYMLIGNDRAIVEPERPQNVLFASGFMLYLVIIVGLSLLVQHRRNRSGI